MVVKQAQKQHLPFPTGPHATGCMDLMTEYSPEGCFARIFYPTNLPTENLEKYSDKWVPWMPHPMYLKAYANNLRVPFFILKYGEKLLNQGAYYIPTISDAPLSDKEESYPLIIFSHGFSATRFICSEYCNTLASYGFIVAAIEHRDNSSAITFYYESPENAEADLRTWVQYHDLRIAIKNTDVDHYTFRNDQMKLRHRECIKLLDTILNINKGVPIENVLKSSFDLKQLKNKINIDKIISSGFSFGGATAMYNAANDSRFRALVVVDGWMFSIKSEQLNINVPIIFINTHTFHTPANINVLLKYFYSKGIRKLYTLKNTTHESVTDTAILYGYWLNPLMLKKMNAKKALNIQSSLTVRFLQENIGYPNSCENSQIFVEKHADEIVEDIIRYATKVRRTTALFF
ncbi:Platelet-activating factor acetylhydrolase-like,Platelet-activating factor acetylhydrolase [Cinara cedri]|uniref:1-alkyl-2-acetylglycerophosphocholine esterase n=1 Tax=Cinara cedri TaxID=506608 RepID=A0A5E4M1N5_9HEMI|nr:Platelet-activating factor acetylhydrolase-like,Platelet-activating factor acetylhydrolase [Cinara cedri]